MIQTLEARFSKFVEPVPESGCHIWTGAIFTDRGYGAFRIGEKQRRAHRVSWELYRGEIPVGLQVLHRCDVRCCVNPDHLFLGTQRDNMHDMIAKGRKVSSRGERNGASKITAEQAKEIFDATGKSQYQLAREYGISQSNVSLIKLGKNWPGVGK